MTYTDNAHHAREHEEWRLLRDLESAVREGRQYMPILEALDQARGRVITTNKAPTRQPRSVMAKAQEEGERSLAEMVLRVRFWQSAHFGIRDPGIIVSHKGDWDAIVEMAAVLVG